MEPHLLHGLLTSAFHLDKKKDLQYCLMAMDRLCVQVKSPGETIRFLNSTPQRDLDRGRSRLLPKPTVLGYLNMNSDVAGVGAP